METYLMVLLKLCVYAQMGEFLEQLVIDPKQLSPIETAVLFRIATGYVHVIKEGDEYKLYLSRTKRMSEYERADVERDLRHFWIEKGFRETLDIPVYVQVSRKPLSRKKLRELDELVKKQIDEEETKKKDEIDKTSMMFL
ncbi:MAG: hypothetical protein ACXQS8_06640 [Candidatus Helarchaeales archaeon]